MAAFAIAPGAARAQVTVVRLGFLHDSAKYESLTSEALLVSADGRSVLGLSWAENKDSPPEDQQLAAVRWGPAGGPQRLADRASPWGISADGTEVGLYLDRMDGSGGGAFYLGREGKGLQSIADVVGSDDSYRPLGMLPDGTVMLGGAESSRGLPLFRWSESGGLISAGSISFPADKHPQGWFSLSAWSDDGRTAAGYYLSSGNHVKSVRWSEQGGLQVLDDLPGGGVGSRAFGISGDGKSILGESQSSFAQGDWGEAVRWNADDGSVVSLGTPAGQTSQALVASTDGSLIAGGTTGGLSPFLWDEAHGTRSLQQLLQDSTSGWDTAADFSNLQVRDMSADGTVLVGAACQSVSSGMCLGPEALLIRYNPVPGDVTNDGRVNLDDFGVLRSNVGLPDARRIDGDLTADGRVSLVDFDKLKSNFGTVPLVGDANGDLFVDAWDFRLLVQDFGKVGSLATDFDGNQRVDLSDFALLRGKLAEVQVPVPEPAGWVLAGLGGLACLVGRRHQPFRG